MLARYLAPLLAALPVAAQELVADFDTGPSSTSVSSNPGAVIAVGGGLGVFANSEAETGREPWRTDGTTNGTELLIDLFPGAESSDPADFVALANGAVVFSARAPTTGRELYLTDGSASGTSLLADLQPGSGDSDPRNFVVAGAYAFFFATTSTKGRELWRTDGTLAGTTLVRDLIAGPPGIVDDVQHLRIARLGTDEVVFTIRRFGLELWKSDGTHAGTTHVTGLPSPVASPPDELTTFGNAVLLRVWEWQTPMAWITDGTPGGTFSLGAEQRSTLRVAGSFGYFAVEVAPGVNELFVTDGTVGGTQLLVDLTPSAGQSSAPEPLGAVGSDLIFASFVGAGPRQLVRSDGTASGTSAISSLAPEVGLETPVGVHAGELWFGTPDAGGALVRTDGTAAGTAVAGPAIAPRNFGSPGGALLFSAEGAGLAGRELWSFDGAGTQQVFDATPPALNAGSRPRLVGEFHGEAFYAVRPTGSPFQELWATDGLGVRLVTETSAPVIDASGPRFARTGAHFLFVAESAFWGVEPHVSDGTATTTLDLVPGALGSDAGPPAVVGGRYLFAATLADGRELYASDGTLAGTTLVADIAPGSAGSDPADFFVADIGQGERLFFTANDGTRGREPWMTDGTLAGTVPLGDCYPGPNGQANVEFGAVGASLLFAADDGTLGTELWVSDGTPANTQLLDDLAPGTASSSPRDFVQLGTRCFFLAGPESSPVLYSASGAPGGTVNFTGLPFDVKSPLLPISDTLAAVWIGGPSVDELWRIDSTLYQPLLVRAFDPYDVATQPATGRRVGVDRLVFGADDGLDGEELWTTDGTLAGTVQLTDVPTTLAPSEVARAGKQLVYRADDGLVGLELFRTPLAETGTWIAETYGTAAAPGSPPTIGVAGVARASSPAPFQITLGEAASDSIAFLVWSMSPGSVSVPGGTLWLGGTLRVEPVITNPAGVAALSVATSPGMAGLRVCGQWFVLDGAGPIQGICSASRALELVVGP
ncbi:MAG: ELWxxDGT repeat protein [Planctomycetota bacterium]